MSEVVRIQVAACIHDDETSTATITDSADPAVTHWAVYLRKESGEAQFVKDFGAGMLSVSSARKEALLLAAELSMEHSAYIEKHP